MVRGRRGQETLEIASLKGVRGGEYRINVFVLRGKGKIGGTDCDEWRCHGKGGICRNKGGLAVPRARGGRISQA